MNQSIIGVLEQQRRDALVAWYLGQLVPESEEPRRVLNENDLYEYLLIDNQVAAQVDTSRVAQGIASVQQHVHAIYNGMEPGFGAVTQDTQALWRESMSQYSLWAGYQMLEDYPENYLEPALRLDKTSMFQTLESELAQARLAEDTVQTALGNYLQAFETVGNLRVIGAYVDSVNFVDADYYFIGQQPVEPFGLYWRKSRLYKESTGDSAQMRGWTEWKSLESIAGSHIKHCRPVVMDGRMYVVWVESTQKTVEYVKTTRDAVDDADEEFKKVEHFHYAIKLSWCRLDGHWSAPITVHEGESPDELSDNVTDANGKVTKGYRLAVASDHGNSGASRLLISFESIGFQTAGTQASADIHHIVMLNEFLMALTNDRERVAAMLAYMAGTDYRRVQYCVDGMAATPGDQWRIISVKYNPTVPPSIAGKPDTALNTDFELSAKWENSQLVLRGTCAKAVMVLLETEFLFGQSCQFAQTDFRIAVEVETYGDALWFSWEFDNPGSWSNHSVEMKLLHHGQQLAINQFEVSPGQFGRSHGEPININPNDLADLPMPSGGFSVAWTIGPNWDLNDSENYCRRADVPFTMNAVIYHYNVATLWTGTVTLNGAASTPEYHHAWPASDPSTRTYQWGGAGEDRATYGLNGFIVTRESITSAAPHVRIDSTNGACWLDISPVDAGIQPILLNTKCAQTLTRLASLSLEGALSWEAQHSAEFVSSASPSPYLDFNGAHGLYFWEIFFHLPHLIARRLQQEFGYASAQRWLELLFNPQMRVAPLFPPPASTEWLPYWTSRPLAFQDQPAVELEGLTNPDAIARGAPSHYRKAIFMMYLNNLIAWGDTLYRQVTRDTLNEAKLLYVRALSLLGPLSKGRSISRWEPVTLKDAAAEGESTFAWLESDVGETLNGLIPVNADRRPWARLLDKTTFRLPVNTQLLDLWDQLDLRLYNLRHNLTLDGKPMTLALYEAPANPLDLLRAQLNGSSVSARRLGSLSVVPPYRFRAMLPRAQNAVELLMRFGQQVLAYRESQERAEQDELQQGHVLEDLASFAEQLQQYAIDEANQALEVLRSNRLTIVARKRYYDDLVRVDVSTLEKTAHSQQRIAMGDITVARVLQGGGHFASMAPNLFGSATGGMVLGGAAFAAGEGLEGVATVLYGQAQQALIADTQTRRRDEWEHQAKQAELELEAVDEQIEAQAIAVKAAQTSLTQATKAREQAQVFYAFIKDRVTGVGLYQWLSGQMATLYFQAYDAVLSMCLSTEACWQYEIGDRDTRFISTTAWVDNRFGLTAGETLRLGLLQMESAFLNRHERRLEISKTLSLKDLLRNYDPNGKRDSDPLAVGWPAVVETLRTQGEISFQLKSSTFDKDYPGHYLRQLVSVSVSLPVVLKPYQDIHATLSQQTSTYLLKPQIDNVKYLYLQAGDLPDDDDEGTRQDLLVVNPRPNQQIGLSTGVDDRGMFGMDFGDERYLPFEGTGAISRWTLSFPNHESDEQQAMFDTLTDVILHIRYLAVDGGKAFTAEVEKLVAIAEDGEVKAQLRSLT